MWPGYSRRALRCPASARWSSGSTPLPLDLCLDGDEACSHGCSDAVPAVTDDEAVAVAGEPHRRGVATVLEPRAVPLHRHRVDRATAACGDADVLERDPERDRRTCVRIRSLLSLP
jgi:hypothetical protein